MNIPVHGKYEWLPILYDFINVVTQKILEFKSSERVYNYSYES